MWASYEVILSAQCPKGSAGGEPAASTPKPSEAGRRYSGRLNPIAQGGRAGAFDVVCAPVLTFQPFRRCVMAKYMIKVSYSVEGAQGLIEEGGSSRKAMVAKMLEQMGGSLESFYFSFGEDDAYVIAEVPDAISSLAVSLAVNASGAVGMATIPLITAEEMDEACKKSVSYRPPGE